jgi:hypothetical protein
MGENGRLNILVISSYSPHTINFFSPEANSIGKIILERGHNLIIAPGPNLQKIIGDAFLEERGPYIEGKTPKCIGYYVQEAYIPKKERTKFEPDETIVIESTSKEKYVKSWWRKRLWKRRDNAAIEKADAVIVIGGGPTVKKRMKYAAVDCELPTSYLMGSSSIIDKFVLGVGLKRMKVNTINASSYNDLYALVNFIEEYYNKKATR